MSRQELYEKLILSQEQVLEYSKDFAQVYRQERERSRHLEETHQKLKAIVDSISDAVVATDDQLRITEYNKAFEKLFENEKSRIIGTQFTLFLKSKKLINKIKKFKSADSVVLNFEFSLPGQDDSAFQATVTKIEDHQTHRNGFVFVLRDIRETKRLENLRHSLFTFASKEITTPLNGLISFLDYLYEDFKKKLNDDEMAHFQFLIESGQNLEKIIEDLMRLSPLNSENESQVVPVELNETLHDAMQHVELELNDSENQFHFEESGQVYILADKTIFSKAIESILKNFHHLSNGTIEISLETNREQIEIQFGCSSYKDNATNLQDLLEAPDTTEIASQDVSFSLAKDIIEWNGGKFHLLKERSALVVRFQKWNSDLTALVKS